jgi:hypothetical protein
MQLAATDTRGGEDEAATGTGPLYPMIVWLIQIGLQLGSCKGGGVNS